MKLILKVEKKIENTLYTYELFDTHYFLSTVSPNPYYDVNFNPYPVLQEEGSWGWDVSNQSIDIIRYKRRSLYARRLSCLYLEERILTEEYVKLLSDLVTQDTP